MQTPNGLSEIIATFGDIHQYIKSDGTLSSDWQTNNLSHATLPFSLPLDWNKSIAVSRILCHKLLVDVFQNVFTEIVSQNLQSKITTFAGCFTYRQQRTGNKLSTHAWGIALDLNASENEQGTEGNMSMDVVAIFRNNGFKWGGDWIGKTRDPMHFQLATGY